MPSSHSRFWIVRLPNDGAVSGGPTLIVNVSVSASLTAVLSSASVTFHVHVVSDNNLLGVPLILFVAKTNDTPRGREHANAYDSVPLPPVAPGSVTVSIWLPLSHSWFGISASPNDGAVSGPTMIVCAVVTAPKELVVRGRVGLVVTTVSRDICHWKV